MPIILDLGGRWSCTDLTAKKTIPAQVPGCVHTDLLAAKKLPELWWRDNEDQHTWVATHDWRYEREFTVDAALAASDRIELRCEGLDTLAEVQLDGKTVIQADNMFRTWTCDLTGLAAGKHRIAVTFRSVLPVMAAGQEKRYLHAWNCFRPEYAGNAWVRKMACSFGWDWGPMAVTCGLWRPITIVGHTGGRLNDVRLAQRHRAGVVDLTVAADVASYGKPLSLRARAEFAGEVVAESAGPADRPVSLVVADAKLWWPNGQGAQDLYTVTVELLSADGQVVDRWSKRTGLRTIELIQQDDQWGRSFVFRVNGRDIFAKGANWVPADVYLPRITRADYQRLLGDAATCGMNMIRAWGGGIYEQDDFYEVCDELGLMVWQDFMFACAMYPAHEQSFLDNVKAEAIDNVRRLRHHPSIALWCGNNELEQGLVGPEWTRTQMSWDDYGKLFDKLLPAVIAAEDGERAYWPCSPHSPTGERKNFNNPDCGDAHCWDVWFGWATFEHQRTWKHRFQSEFGFQSFPEPRTVAAFTEPSDRHLSSRIMDFHQRSNSRGNKCILAYIADYLPVPMDFDEMLWMTQVSHAECIRIAVEHARRGQPRCQGVMYWQINDIWPAASWSSIDVYGRWKALQYAAARFNAPVLVSCLEDAAAKTVAVHVSNHQPAAFAGTVAWTVTDARGRKLQAGTAPAAVASQSDALIATVDLAPPLDKGRPARDLLVWVEARVGKTVVSRNLATIVRWKHLDLDPKAKPVAAVKANKDGSFAVTVSAKTPALFTRFELDGLDATWSDNFLHVSAAPQTVICRPAKKLDLAGLKKRLRLTAINAHMG
jgi:beta-mannosidase